MDIDPRPFGVAQELVAQADAPVGTFQQARHFHHYEILRAVAHYAEGRLDGGEGVVGHFGARRRAAGNEGGFAGVGFRQQAHIGEEFQFQPEDGVIAAAAGLGEHGFLVGGRHQAGVAETAFAALCHQHRAGGGDVGDKILAAVLVHTPDDGADGDADFRILAVGAALVFALAVAAPLQVEGAVVLQVQQGVEGIVAQDVGAAAIAAIAAIGAAPGLVFEPEEADAAVAPVSGLDVYSDGVNHSPWSSGSLDSNGSKSVDNGQNPALPVAGGVDNPAYCSTIPPANPLITDAGRSTKLRLPGAAARCQLLVC